MDASPTGRRLLVVSVTAGLTFVGLALFVAWRPEPAAWERHVARWSIHLDGVIGRAWKLGSAVVVVPGLLVALGIGILRGRPLAVAIPLVAGVTIALAQVVVKPLVGRPAGLVYGFPSGHAMGSAFLAVALVAALWSSSEGIDLALIVVGTASTVLCGVAAVSGSTHLPVDVLGSWAWVASWSAATTLCAVNLAARPGADYSQ